MAEKNFYVEFYVDFMIFILTYVGCGAIIKLEIKGKSNTLCALPEGWTDRRTNFKVSESTGGILL